MARKANALVEKNTDRKVASANKLNNKGIQRGMRAASTGFVARRQASDFSGECNWSMVSIAMG